MELEASAELQGRRPPWRRTVAVQAALCLALYAAFSLGEPQLRPRGGDALGSGGPAGGGVSFITVAGGARPPADQARLLRQMESIAKVYGVKLVLDVAQLGDDRLWQNGSLYFQALNIPWYSTTSHGQIVDNFLKKVKMPYDQILEIIGVDTGPLQELLHHGKVSNSSREQITWLEQTLALSSSNWKIVVGYDALVDCNEVHTTKTVKFYEPLRNIFQTYAVNAYVSTSGSCGEFHEENSMLYIQNPSPGDHNNLDGFFLHRVSPLEMESLLINLEGEVVQRSLVHQQGRGAIMFCIVKRRLLPFLVLPSSGRHIIFSSIICIGRC
ncbi:uncharacterized protein [Lolium perenne]|uniref:uncharacterized protein isoform X1 n=1 Tax=Lolium perenne TaxID=4522 RepID=UPI0021F5C1E3|nr:uncharacterized protein LOC127319104 isoform X2 [Lolium perenne]